MNSDPESWKDEAYKAYVAKWEAEETQESERRRQEGKIAVWLEPAEDDAPTFTRAHQAELRNIVAQLKDEGVEFEAPFMTVDSVEAVSGYTGQLIIPLALIAVPALTRVLVAWVKANANRKATIEFYPTGKIKKVSAQTEEGVIKLVDAVHQQKRIEATTKKTK